MSGADWDIEYDDDGIPVQMRWNPKPTARQERRCPKSWPHDLHGPWWTGGISQAGDLSNGPFTCPGVVYVAAASLDEPTKGDQPRGSGD